MGIIDLVLEEPAAWPGERLVRELPLQMYDDERRMDGSLPGWLRDVILLCDFDTHVQMEGPPRRWGEPGVD